MKAVTLQNDGIRIVDTSVPAPNDFQVLVKVHACGLNRSDLLETQGQFFGHMGSNLKILGGEFAGEVIELGSKVTNLSKGDNVMCRGGSGWAEYALAHHLRCIKFDNNQIKSNLLIIETSTLPLECKKTVKKQLDTKKISIVDAPLSGNRLAALDGKLSSYLSGSTKDKKLATSVLNFFCKKVTDVGVFGNGTVMKLIGNILNLVHNAVTAEVMTLGMKSGLDPKIIHEAISGTFSSSGVFENRGKLMADDDYKKEGMNFSTPMKDSKFITELSRNNLVALPIYQVALQYYYSAVANNLGNQDASSIIKILERNTNLKKFRKNRK